MKTQDNFKKMLVLFDRNNNENIAVFDITNAAGEIMEYNYYYFGGYKYYIEFLLRRGAVKQYESSEETAQAAQTKWKTVEINEIPKRPDSDANEEKWLYTSFSPKVFSAKSMDS